MCMYFWEEKQSLYTQQVDMFVNEWIAVDQMKL